MTLPKSKTILCCSISTSQISLRSFAMFVNSTISAISRVFRLCSLAFLGVIVSQSQSKKAVSSSSKAVVSLMASVSRAVKLRCGTLSVTNCVLEVRGTYLRR